MSTVRVLRSGPAVVPPLVETTVTLPLTVADFRDSGKSIDVSLPYNTYSSRLPFSGYVLEVVGEGYNDLHGTLVYIPNVRKDRWLA